MGRKRRKESNQPNKNQRKQNFVRPDLRFNIFDTLVGISWKNFSKR